MKRDAAVIEAGRGLVDARVVFLTHYIPLYQVRVLQSIAQSVRDFHVLVSTPIEPNRDFAPDWSGLDVTVQDTWTLRRQWRHRGHGSFADSLYVHVPYDTMRQLTTLDPDIVMSLELGARSYGAARYCRRANKKLILCTYMSERTEQSRGWLRRNLRRHLLRHADAVTYNGPSCRRYLETFGVDPTRMFPLAYAADDRTLYRGPVARNEASTRGRFLVVGQLNQRKGVIPLAEQFCRYAQSNPGREMELWFAGNGPQRGDLESMELPENVRLRLLGNIPADRLGDVMMRCSALIAPTLADEWMLVVNESLQAGLPVVGSIYSQAVTTLVEDNVNGWHYDPVEAWSFESALNRYFDLANAELAGLRDACRRGVQHRTPRWAARGAIDAINHVYPKRDNGANDSPVDVDPPTDATPRFDAATDVGGAEVISVGRSRRHGSVRR